MELNGKCKEEFKGWYRKLAGSYDPRQGYYTDFTWFTDSMKYGVYVDYFDSVGGRIETMRHSIDDMWGCYINGAVQGVRLKSRPEARTKAIERANEFRNEQLK